MHTAHNQKKNEIKVRRHNGQITIRAAKKSIGSEIWCTLSQDLSLLYTKFFLPLRNVRKHA